MGKPKKSDNSNWFHLRKRVDNSELAKSIAADVIEELKPILLEQTQSVAQRWETDPFVTAEIIQEHSNEMDRILLEFAAIDSIPYEMEGALIDIGSNKAQHTGYLNYAPEADKLINW